MMCPSGRHVYPLPCVRDMVDSDEMDSLVFKKRSREIWINEC